MNSLIVDFPSIFDSYVKHEIVSDGSPNRSTARISHWLDSKINSMNSDKIYVVSRDKDKFTPESDFDQNYFYTAAELWAAKNNAFLIKPPLENDTLEVVGSIQNMLGNTEIASTDLRVTQLLSENVSILQPFRQEPYTSHDLSMELGGLLPDQIPVFLALIGHSESNTQPISGMQNSLELVLLCKNNPQKIVAEAKKRKEYDFVNIAKSENALMTNLLKTTAVISDVHQNDLIRIWSQDAANQLGKMMLKEAVSPKSIDLPNIMVSVTQVVDEKTMNDFVAISTHAQAFGLITEKDNTGIYALTFSFKEGSAFYVPLNIKNGQRNQEDFVLNKIKEIIEGDSKIIAFSAYELSLDLMKLGIGSSNISADCASGKYLLNTKNELMDISDLLINSHKGLPTSSEFIAREGRGLAQNAGLDKCSVFSGIRADLVWKNSKSIFRSIIEENLKQQYSDFDIPQAKICAKMSHRGIKVDLQNIEKLKTRGQSALANIHAQVAAIYPEKNFSLDKPADVIAILKYFGLETSKTANGGYSIDKDELAMIANSHKVVPLIQKARQLHESISKGLDVLKKHCDSEAVMRTTFVVNRTLTTRLSTINPNAHGSTEIMRQNMVAREGYAIACFDISQMELRVLAHLSGESKLIEAFQQGIDIHIRTASEVFNCSIHEVTENQRKAAKAINFGLIYGMSAFGLAKSLSVTKNTAQQYIDVYFERLPGVKRLQEAQINDVRREGYYTLETGRRIYFPDINSENNALRASTERSAINAPMQGTAAEVVKRGMILAEQNLEKSGIDAHLLLQVHDELIFEIPIPHLSEATKIITKSIENGYPMRVPIVVEAVTGPNMGKKQNPLNDLSIGMN
jgi:DNA polymerase-1